MNIVFWFLCLLAIFGLWLLLSVIFIPLGKIIINKYKKLYRTLTMDTEQTFTKENKERKGE